MAITWCAGPAYAGCLGLLSSCNTLLGGAANGEHAGETPAASSASAVPPSSPRPELSKYTLAPARDSAAGSRQECGPGELTSLGKAQLLRGPYLQRLGSSSVEFMYKLEPGTHAGDVVYVSTPAGVPVMAVPSRPDPAVRDGTQRLAFASHLASATHYCYSVNGLTTRIGFRTAPQARRGALVRFGVLGDSGAGSQMQAAIFDQLQAAGLHLLLHTGDLAYEVGSLEQFERFFFGVYRELLQSVPIFPVPGNHDYGTDDAGPYLEVFELPDNAVKGERERWYSFDWGDVHFVALDTERIGAQQTEWLERDLAANRRPWVVAYLHRPPHSSGHHGSASDVAAAFSATFERHRVPIVFAGHEHSYERTVPINGTIYVITGGGGKTLRGVGASRFTAFSESVHHFVSVEVDGAELRLRAIDAMGHELDSVAVTR